MGKWQAITVASTGSVGIEAIKKLYRLGYDQSQIRALTANHSRNDVFVDYCSKKLLQIFTVDQDHDMVNVPGTDVLLCIGGLPFLLSQNSISKFSYSLNLHTGLTQISRGRWQSSWAILLDFPYTGYTWHHINEMFDSGNIICQKKIPIESDDTALSLNTKIFESALGDIGTVLEKCATKGKPQKKLGRYFDRKIPYKGEIDPLWPPEMIKKMIRAMYHPPYDPAKYKDHLVDNYEKYLEIKHKISNTESPPSQACRTV